jgi:thiamine-monophosphate kinase
MAANTADFTEFGMIDRLLGKGRFKTSDDVIVGPGDDCAVVNVPSGFCLAYSIDTCVAGVHFPEHTSARVVACRSLGTSISDLAAMGADPQVFTLALTLPHNDLDWLEQFAGALAEMAAELNIVLVGGDLTRGPLTVTVHVSGLLRQGTGLLRSGAKPGDHIYVSGTLGDAAAGLEYLVDGKRDTGEDIDYLVARFCRPQPRITLGKELVNIASAAIDISDGLMADLAHICHASTVGARVEAARVPLSVALKKTLSAVRARELALNGGDDYELCFTVPPALAGRLTGISEKTGIALCRIGSITGDREITCIGPDGEPVITGRGYQHFEAT